MRCNTLIYMYDLHCWEYGVLQLVSEQVGLSGQVVESVVSSDDYFCRLFCCLSVVLG